MAKKIKDLEKKSFEKTGITIGLSIREIFNGATTFVYADTCLCVPGIPVFSP